jgi:hypothetical protein
MMKMLQLFKISFTYLVLREFPQILNYFMHLMLVCQPGVIRLIYLSSLQGGFSNSNLVTAAAFCTAAHSSMARSQEFHHQGQFFPRMSVLSAKMRFARNNLHSL